MRTKTRVKDKACLNTYMDLCAKPHKSFPGTNCVKLPARRLSTSSLTGEYRMRYVKTIYVSVLSIVALCGCLINVALADAVISDAKGKIIGSVMQISDGAPGYPEVIRKMSPETSVHFSVSKFGLSPNNNLHLFFISADCSGPAYMFEEPDVIIPRAYFVQSGGYDGGDFTKGTLFYASPSVVQVTLSSERSSTFGACRTFAPGLGQLHPAIAVDVSSWRLVLPLKVK